MLAFYVAGRPHISHKTRLLIQEAVADEIAEIIVYLYPQCAVVYQFSLNGSLDPIGVVRTVFSAKLRLALLFTTFTL